MREIELKNRLKAILKFRVAFLFKSKSIKEARCKI